MIAPEAWSFVLAPLCVGVASAAVGLAVPGWLLIAAGAAALFLFRDPPRSCTQAPDMVCAPVDGRVVELSPSPETLTDQGMPMRMCIHLSLFDVRVSRAVIDGELVATSTQPRRPGLALVEDHLSIWQARLGPVGLRHAVLPNRGAPEQQDRPGRQVQRGERLGLVGCGMTVELFLPSNAQLLVRPGDRMRAGETSLARILPGIAP